MVTFKKFLILFTLLGISVGASAATIGLTPFVLDPTETAGPLSGGYNISNLNGVFNENIVFQIVNAPSGGVAGSANVISVQLGSFFGVDTLTATLNGTPLTISSPVSSLKVGVIDTNFVNGIYTLNLSGTTFTGGATLSGNAAINSVPIPASAWLLGSALVGLFGVKRRSYTRA